MTNARYRGVKLSPLFSACWKLYAAASSASEANQIVGHVRHCAVRPASSVPAGSFPGLR
jgi:hypothetical protein